MANIYLGLSGSALTLPHTITDSLPTSFNKKISQAVMSDGSVRYAMYVNQETWQLNWVKLTVAQLATLITLWGYNQVLTYQNNDESATWYNVAITTFSYDVINPMGTTQYFRAAMTLEQVV